jgi:hypothetical protein
MQMLSRGGAIMKNISAIILPLFSLACTHIDTGQIDYRLAEPPAILSSEAVARHNSGDALNPVKLVRRYQVGGPGAEAPFAADDVYSIMIDQGVIGGQLLEGKLLGKEFSNTAQFAILANVFQFANGAAEAKSHRFLEFGPGSDPLKSDGEADLKLVYYSGDVKRGQPLNFSHIPIVPRTTYAGSSIGIQIVIMEIDSQSGPMRSLLSTLADFGQKATPHVPGVTDVLFDLGKSLFLGGSHDDRIFEYRFVLSAPGSSANAAQPTFTPGRYVLLRSEKRDVDQRWEKLRLDHNTGRLFTDTNQPLQTHDDLYLVLNIEKYSTGTAQEFYEPQTWPAFRTALNSAIDTQAQPLAVVTKYVSAMLVRTRSAQWKDELALKWASAKSRLEYYSANTLAAAAKTRIAGTPMSQCKIIADAELNRNSGLAKRDAQLAVDNFVALYIAAMRANAQAMAASMKDPALSNHEFTEGDRNAIATLLAQYFIPFDVVAGTEALLRDASAFEAGYTGTPAKSNLTDDALAIALSRATDTDDCNQLKQRGLAVDI